ncbi:(2Fe-2S)-binding protein [Mechercharimyces sp. CAU 1602]|uniref:2Fe-2S iron-sulfur cluster-binding protein n=1 Tax=Mechercharimyces sp. CAU 1602 TaxID=2973933 RepID=UPI00216336B4|nr:(2Fe-2S)-binding protein [Mechercharimyces sp. CAU 1602]MCS1350503.1 (2Fe-2S)-binding protein [Mechercharimyces sp. CAU 1602]
MSQVTVKCKGEEYQVSVDEGAPLLVEAIMQSVPIPYNCTSARCGTCKVKIVAGRENVNEVGENEELRLGEDAVEDGYRLACQLDVYGPLTIEVPPNRFGW